MSHLVYGLDFDNNLVLHLRLQSVFYAASYVIGMLARSPRVSEAFV